MRPLPHTLYAIRLVTIFITFTRIDTGDIYKKGKKVRKYKGEVYIGNLVTKLIDIRIISNISGLGPFG